MSSHPNDEPATDAIDPVGVALLVENHRAFLRYLERRTGSRAIAEDILQDAFVRNLDRLDTVPNEALTPWFYRVLRNALIDRSRRAGAEERALAALANELSVSEAPSRELHTEICACIGRLVQTLKPEYADVLRAVDLDDVPVKTFAQTSGLGASNAGVRLFRARQALKQRVSKSCGTCADHGCLDCSCGKPR
jgi:RNA polymerase sigma factor (sigma-70 family)